VIPILLFVSGIVLWPVVAAVAVVALVQEFPLEVLLGARLVLGAF